MGDVTSSALRGEGSGAMLLTLGNDPSWCGSEVRRLVTTELRWFWMVLASGNQTWQWSARITNHGNVRCFSHLDAYLRLFGDVPATIVILSDVTWMILMHHMLTPPWTITTWWSINKPSRKLFTNVSFRRLFQSVSYTGSISEFERLHWLNHWKDGINPRTYTLMWRMASKVLGE
jgi:hypothetical protein